MSDDKYFCSVCRKPTEPRMYEPGPGAACHEDAPLLVAFCPSYPDKCQGCEFRPLDDSEMAELTEELLADSGDRRAYQRHWES